jgi:hypothetical protein
MLELWIMIRPEPLDDALLENLIVEQTTSNTVGFILTGSFNRNDWTEYSDVDLVQFVRILPEDEKERYSLRYVNNRLVSLSKTTIEKKREEMSKPDEAMWTVPGLREARLLSDPDGLLEQLKQDALSFEWATMQHKADEHASWDLMGYTEEVHKILGGLSMPNESMILWGTLGMVLGMTGAMAVHRGVLIQTENYYFERVQEEVGLDSMWTKYHRLAAGFDRCPKGLSPAECRGIAGLGLYTETARILRPTITAEHAQVVDTTLKIIEDSGHLPRLLSVLASE